MRSQFISTKTSVSVYQTEEALFTDFQSVDDRLASERALAEYFTINKAAIYLFAYNLLRNQPDAEDITSKAFIALWENRDKIENQEHVRSYLYLVARNGALDILRNNRSSAAHKKFLRIQGQESALSNVDIVEAEFYSPLYSEIQKLPERMRDVFVLTYLKNLPARRVSEIMGIQIVTVYTVCQRAMNRIKFVLQKPGTEAITISAFFFLSLFLF